MSDVRIRQIGVVDYLPTYEKMVELTESRDSDTADEIWLLQHPRVFTQGQAGKAEHVLLPGDIPVVQTNRGGQVTYHGPGQLVAYLLLDIKRLGIGPRQLVSAMENAIIATLSCWNIESAARPDAPGVYVDGRKIASLGLRIRNGKTFHGLALNVDMDLEPFQRINPCGYAGLQMTQVRSELERIGSKQSVTLAEVASELQQQLLIQLGLNMDAEAAKPAAAASEISDTAQ